MTGLRIVLADDHTMLRECLRQTLEGAGHAVVGEGATGEEAFDVIRRLRPDVAVVDITMPDGGGLAVCRQVRRHALGVPVVVLTMHGDPELADEARAAGARAVLVKDCTTSTLLCSLEAVAAGHRVSGAEVVTMATREPPSPPPLPISPREVEVLRLLAAGAGTSDIAELLFISPKTVKNHLASIYDKLGCRDRIQAALWAWENGLADAG